MCVAHTWRASHTHQASSPQEACVSHTHTPGVHVAHTCYTHALHLYSNANPLRQGSVAHSMYWVGQNRTYTPNMTVCMVISLLKIPCVHHMYVYSIHVWCWPTLSMHCVLAHSMHLSHAQVGAVKTTLSCFLAVLLDALYLTRVHAALGNCKLLALYTGWKVGESKCRNSYLCQIGQDYFVSINSYDTDDGAPMRKTRHTSDSFKSRAAPDSGIRLCKVRVVQSYCGAGLTTAEICFFYDRKAALRSVAHRL